MKPSEELYTIGVDISDNDEITISILRRSLGEGPDVVVRTLHGKEASEFHFRYLTTIEEKLNDIGEMLKEMGANAQNAQLAIYKLMDTIKEKKDG